MMKTSYIIPLIPAVEPYRGVQRSAEPGLHVHPVEKTAFRRDREWSGQTSFGEKERRESFSGCYTRMAHLREPEQDSR